ncbi:MAG: hypothetical protein HYW33_00870 [Candidatus Blackburnbacteria bacterium]|nr:hypothetical protein [Candidatus Blackburnbacteria bacterium]
MIITPASYSSGQAPIGHWRLDENTGTSANDSSTSGATGTISGANWKPGKYGASLNFDGTDDSVTVSTSLSSVKTVEFWVNPSSATASMIALNGSAYITSSSGTISATGFADTKVIYVNGIVNGTITANSWNHVAVTTTTGITASAITFGLANSTYLTGKLDDIRIYNYVRTQKQVISDMMGDGARSPVMAGSSSGGSGGQGGSGRAGGAVAYYKFDEGYGTTVHNSGSQGETLQGTLTNMATSPSTATSGWTQSGKFGKGLVFDGSNDYVDTGSKFPQLTSTLTISAWVKPGTSQGGYADIWGNHQDGFKGMVLQQNSSDLNSYYFSYGNGSAWIGNSNVFSLTASIWQHVTVVKTSTTCTIYVNAVQSTSYSCTSDVTPATTINFQIGQGYATGNSRYFNGQIDEVKIYPYALTADEVKLDYNKGSSLVLGALGDNASYQPNAANQEYCIPGDAASCAAPVGRWDFDENTGSTVNDKSGNGNTGTWNGTLGNQWKPGKIGGSGNFNGSNNYVDVGDVGINSGSFTMEGWVKFNSVGADTGIIGKNKTSGYAYLELENNNTLRFLLRNESGVDIFNILTTATYTTNTWYHLAVVYNSSSGGTLYVNNAVAGSSSSTGSYAFSSGVFEIGRLSNNNNRYLNGIVDQVRVFNYARSAAQIAWDYNRGAPVGHWKFDECQGNIAHDSAIPPSGGSFNHGTINIGGSGSQSTSGTCTTPTDGTGAWYNGRTGKFNSSLNFDGTDDYVDAGDNTTVDVTNSITIAAWIRLGALNLNQSIVSRDDGTNRNFAFQVDSNNNLNFYWFSSNSSTGRNLTAITTLTTGTWYQVVATYQNGVAQSIYLNGVSDATTLTPTGNIDNDDVSLTIGAREDGTDRLFNGQIDDVRIYNYALTPLQVKLLYNQNSAIRFGPSTGAP